MSMPPMPPLDELRERRFSFYPPIAGVEHNEWMLVEATWSEVVVKNTKSELEVGIPRRYFGNVSQVDDPVMIVGLTRELDYKAGAVWPLERKVVSIPGKPQIVKRAGVVEEPPVAEPKGLGAVIGTGSEGTEARMGKLILILLGTLVFVAATVWSVVHFTPAAKTTYTAKDQDYLRLTRSDDAFTVERKLGSPTEEAWRPDAGELQYKKMYYKERGYTVILMGTDQKNALYVGTLGPEWQVLHTVEYANGSNTAGMLRELKRF